MCMIMRIITSLKYVMRNVYDHAYHCVSLQALNTSCVMCMIMRIITSLKYVMRNVYDHAYHYKP